MTFRRSSIGRGVILAAALAVAACAEIQRIPSPFVSCAIAPPGVFDDIDWDAARRINVRIRDGEFRPSLIRLYQDRPYVMQVENRDRGARRFQSSEFFRALFIHSITTDGYGKSNVKCPAGLWVPPGGFTEIRFIAARDGRYEYADTLLPFDVGSIPDGIVHIERAPVLAGLMPPAIPGITKPDVDVPTGPYAPASLPVVPPAPETPALPVDPATFPVPMPAPEMPGLPVDPATLPIPLLPPEMPAIPAEPVTLPLPLPAPEAPALPVEPSALPVPSSTPEAPAQPIAPSALPSAPLFEMSPPSTKPVAPESTPSPVPAKPRTLAPEHAPGAGPQPKPGGVGLFGQ